MPDVLIKSLPNATALTTSPGLLDLLLIEKYQSGGDPTVPSNNTYVSENVFVRDYFSQLMALLGLSGANKIINGDMRIDQRNAGASLTPTTDSQYTLDRWSARLSQSSKFSVQQVAGSTLDSLGAPIALKVTSLSSYSVGASEFFTIEQSIESNNLQDLLYGNAAAQNVTISFPMQASISGTYGFVLVNNNASYSYPFSFALTANTPALVTATIPGDAAHALGVGITAGLTLRVSLGAGATVSASVGSWQSGNFRSVTGAVSLVGTNTATMYFGNVKLEVGSVATPFVPDDYAVAFAKCRRYCQVYNFAAFAQVATGQAYSTASAQAPFQFPNMRAAPSVTVPAVAISGAGFSFLNSTAGNPVTQGSIAASAISDSNLYFVGTGYTAAFVAGNASILQAANTCVLTLTSEL